MGEPDLSTFRTYCQATEPGGLAVNVSSQVHALGGEVGCDGHFDDPVFDALEFETVSMGEPADVYAIQFEADDVMVADGDAQADWSLVDLRGATALSTVVDVNAVCAGNWASSPATGPALRELGTGTIPGAVRLRPRGPRWLATDDIVALRESLATLQDCFDVVHDANPAELGPTAATLPDPPADDHEQLAALRAADELAAGVGRGRREAAVGSADGVTAVEMPGVEDPIRHTGGGDRFAGGLGFALANGWNWALALACGNACVATYVATGRPATVERLREGVFGRS